jgi:hypothetical protein
MMRVGKIAAKWRHARLTGGTCCAADGCQHAPDQTQATSLHVTVHLHPGKL